MVLERVKVRSEFLGLLYVNDPGLTGELLQKPVVRRRHRIALGRGDAWRLGTGGSDLPEEEAGPEGEAIEVSVRLAARIPVRPVRLIAEGFGLSWAEVERLLAEGNLVSAVRLSGRNSGDFTFTLKR